MINFKIESNPNIQGWDEFIQAEQKLIKKAAVKAIDNTTRWLRPEITEQAANDLNISVTTVKRHVIATRAKQSNLTGFVGIKNQKGVIKAVELGKPKQTETGVKVAKREINRGFVATMKTGHTGIYKRVGKTRLPIRESYLVITGKIADALAELEHNQGVIQFQKYFDRELRTLRRLNT